MKDETIKVVAAIAGITVCYSVAAFNGVNGLAFASVVAALTGLGGYLLHDRIKQ